MHGELALEHATVGYLERDARVISAANKVRFFPFEPGAAMVHTSMGPWVNDGSTSVRRGPLRLSATATPVLQMRSTGSSELAATRGSRPQWSGQRSSSVSD